MHFGRMLTVQGVDFKIPPDTNRTEKFLALPRDYIPNVLVGCPIWASKEWSNFYPKGTKPDARLNYYASQFRAVELNSTFYQLLGPERIADWREKTGPEFRFCPKVYRGITEGLADPALPDLVRTYCRSIAGFENRLGLVFAQLPEWLDPGKMELLKRLLMAWPKEISLAIEFRHPAWFQNHALRDDAVNLLYRHQTATVITDTPGRRDVLHTSLTQPRVLIRFQGVNGDATDEVRLRAWADKVLKWEKHALESIYLFVHQPEESLIPQTAKVAMKAMGQTSPQPEIEGLPTLF